MFKEFQKSGFCGLALLAALSFTACSEDEDENGGGGNQPDSPAITTQNGDKVLLTSVGGRPIIYDKAGRITDFDGVSYSYDPFRILDDDGMSLGKVTLTEEGYLHSISYNESEDGVSSKGNITFSYDAAGHLKEYKENYEAKEDGEVIEKETSRGVLTWEGDKLVKSRTTAEGFFEGQSYNEGFSYELSYAADAPANRVGQFSTSLAWAYQIEHTFCFVGLLGTPSAYFPTHVKAEGSYEDENIDKDCSYVFNEDGTLRSETESIFGWSVDYTYATLSEITASYLKPQGITAKRGVKSLLKRHRRR